MTDRALARRYRRERILVGCGKAAVLVALGFMAVLVASVVATGWRALVRADIALDITFDPATINPDGSADVLAYGRLARTAIVAAFPTAAKGRKARRAVRALVSDLGAGVVLRAAVAADPGLIGTTTRMWLPAAALAEAHLKGSTDATATAPQAELLDRLKAQGRTRLGFNTRFFTHGDSRSPELAGIGGALMGSLLALLVTFIVAFPIAVGAAVYLELFAPRNRLFDLIEININNLAAVPSVIMGLLGLAVFLNLFGMPRSSALVGGLVLALMTFPTILVAARAALKSVPPHYLQGAVALGATRMQGVRHFVLPAAMPGILTGAIIGMAQALGETAPLLMIGMVAFVVSVPTSLTDPATALPVQIFLWADQPERGYVERTALAIMVLLAFLLAMNAAAIWLRHRLEQHR